MMWQTIVFNMEGFLDLFGKLHIFEKKFIKIHILKRKSFKPEQEKMIKRIIIFCFFLNSCNAQELSLPGSLKLISSVSLPNISGRIDHLAFDEKHSLVFVAALGNSSVEVVDLKNKITIHSIKSLSEPQGIIFIPESSSLIIANGGTGDCDVYNTESFQKITSVKLGDDADNLRYDSVGKKIYAGYGNGGIAVIDAVSFKIISKIELPGHPESFQLDETAKKLFVNVPDKREIDVIDLKTNSVAAKWKIDARANYPMSLDEKNHCLFIACRIPSKLLVIDSHTGKTIFSGPVDADADDVFYDAQKKEIYISCGSGYIDSFTQTSGNTYEASGKTASRPGARTSLLIPELNKLIVACPASFNKDAQLMIYETKSK